MEQTQNSTSAPGTPIGKADMPPWLGLFCAIVCAILDYFIPNEKGFFKESRIPHQSSSRNQETQTMPFGRLATVPTTGLF
jgi:hypothetical protein